MAALIASTRPPSQNMQRVRTFKLNVLRDQHSLATWLLIGAAWQCSLLALPIPPRFTVVPTLALLCLKLLQGIVTISAYKPGTENIVTSRPMYAKLDGRQDSTGGVCVLLLGFRITHPLGLVAPGVSGVIRYFDEMAADLEGNAERHGFLGAKRYLSAGDASRVNEICTVFYFDSHEAVLAWSHETVHMKGWLWWNSVHKKYPYLGLMHEMYDSPEGMWEATYVNYPTSGLGATSFPVDTGKGQNGWQSALAVQGKGARTSLGRMGRSDGTDNDDRATWPYDQ